MHEGRTRGPIAARRLVVSPRAGPARHRGRHHGRRLPAAAAGGCRPCPQPGDRGDRAPVERTFALLKRWYGYGRVRYRSLGRNALQLQLLALAFNLRRGLVLTG